MACTANNTQNVTLQIKVRRALPLPLCRWWLKTRPCSRGIHHAHDDGVCLRGCNQVFLANDATLPMSDFLC
jgi:hypothetical protein